ncbi:hypothetical protein GCM10009850_044210 [Nonomuraea monospora]|uniref:Uncharacterized protein n=1 Tax=Nonomuraea monospora TaxID=568818 RepID=A0ABN3CHY0_9ACTN
MSRTVITTGNPAAPLSQAVRKGPVLQVSGQLPLDPDTGEVAGATVAEQTAQYAAAVGEPFPARTTVYMGLPPGLLGGADCERSAIPRRRTRGRCSAIRVRGGRRRG